MRKTPLFCWSRAKAQRAEPANLLFCGKHGRPRGVADRVAIVRQGAERGRAAWPRPRRLLAGPLDQELRGNDLYKVFIKCLQDVAHSSFELYPENSGFFHFLKNPEREGFEPSIRVFTRITV